MLLLQSLLPFRFHSNPGPQTTRPPCHFLGLSENASSFSGQKGKKEIMKRPLGSRLFSFPFLRGVHGSHIPNWKPKKKKGTTRRWQTSSADHSLRVHRRWMRGGGSRMRGPSPAAAAGKASPRSDWLTQAAKGGRLAGLFRALPKAA